MSAERNPATEQLLMTTTQAAKLLGIGRTTVYALIKEGQLRPVHIARSCRISRAELDRFVARLDGEGTDAEVLRLVSSRGQDRPQDHLR
jgi:excisionase family DNA binding protein